MLERFDSNMISRFTSVLISLYIFVGAIAVGTVDYMPAKWCAFISLAATFAMVIYASLKKRFDSFVNPLFVAVTGYVIWAGLSIAWSDVPKASMLEYTKLLTAYAVYMAVLTFVGKNTNAFRRLSYGISTVTAIYGLVSMDAVGDGPISKAFKKLSALITDQLQYVGLAEEGTARLESVFGNANTFSGFIVLGIILAIALAGFGESKKERIYALALLGISAMAYILLISRGSIAILIIACLVMIVLAETKNRVRLMLILLESGILTLALSVKTFAYMMEANSSGMVIMAVLNAALLVCLDLFLVGKISEKLADSKAIWIGVGVAAVLLVAAAFAVFNVTEPVEIGGENDGWFYTAVVLSPGEYGLDYEADTTIRVILRSKDDTGLKVRQNLGTDIKPMYNDEKISFIVPKGAEVTYMWIGDNERDEEKTHLLKKVLILNKEGKKVKDITLNHRFIPKAIASRMLNLSKNQNLIQREVYVEDALKLFKQKPIVGWGLSGFEKAVYSVQNYHYESRFVHNHYAQTLCDLGIIGFAFAMAMLVCGVITIVMAVRNRIKNGAAAGYWFVPVAAALVIQMYGQAISDLTWSFGPFLLVAFALHGMLTLYGQDLSLACGDGEGTPIADRRCDVEEAAAASAAGSKQDAAAAGSSKKAESSQSVSEAGSQLTASAKPPVVTGGLCMKVLILVCAAIMLVLMTMNMYAHYKAASGNCTMDQMAGLTKIDKFDADDYKLSYIVTATSYGLTDNYPTADQYARELSVNPDAVLDYLIPYYFNTDNTEGVISASKAAIKYGKADPDMWNGLLGIYAQAVDTDREDPVPVILRLQSKKGLMLKAILGYYHELEKRNADYLDTVTLTAANNQFIGKLLGIEKLDATQLTEAVRIFKHQGFDLTRAVDADKNGIPDDMDIRAEYGKFETGKDGRFTGAAEFAEGTAFTQKLYSMKGGEYQITIEGLAPDRELSLEVEEGVLNIQRSGNTAQAALKLPAGEKNLTIKLPKGGHITGFTITKK